MAQITPTLCLLQDMEADSEERAPAGLVPAAAMGGVGDAAVNPSLAAAAASGAAGQAAGEAGGGEEAVVRHTPHGRGVEIVQHWLAGIDDADTSGLLSGGSAVRLQWWLRLL